MFRDTRRTYREILQQLNKTYAKQDVRKGPLEWKDRGQQRPNINPVPQENRKRLRRRWFAAASVTRRSATLGLSTVPLFVCIGLLAPASQRALSYDYDSHVSSITVLWNPGFGTPNPSALIGFVLPFGTDATMMGAVLLANLPQVAMSYFYVLYTELFACMLLAHEWSTYAVKRKGLRVTTPRPQTHQRPTYSLSLPYKYKVPLPIMSAVAHRLVSSSLFSVRVSVYQGGVLQPNDITSELGFSCAPMICVLFLGFALLLVTLILGCRKFASSMPVASHCSVAIAAACYRPASDDRTAYREGAVG